MNPAAPAGSSETGSITAAKFDFWRTAHRALRGRYRLVCLLATGGALVGGAIGLKSGQRLYSSSGLVRIASVLPEVMHETDQNRPMAMFDGFIQAQRDVMTSREMIEAAMQEATWKRVELTGKAPSEAQFAAMLKVETRPRSDHLKITFADEDPGVAAAAVRSIIAAYQRTYIRQQDAMESQRIAELKTRHESLTAQLARLQADAGPDANAQTALELEPMYNAAADCERKLRAALVDVQCAIAGVPDLNDRQITPERLPEENAADELLHSAVDAEARAESDLTAALNRGYGPSHPIVIRLRAAIEEDRRQVEECVHKSAMLRSQRAAGPSTVSLTQREANLRQLAASTEKEMKRIAARQAQLTIFEHQSAAILQDLKETDGRLDALTTEASLGSRFTVISNGDIPMTPSLDNRLKVAFAATLSGGAIPLGLMILLAGIRRQYRYGDELAEDLLKRVPLVALLPEVVSDGELNSWASHCIHELRGRLQPEKAGQSRAYLVTSTSPGEGTTSLTLSLGLSAVAAGLRTLVIDANLGSRRLTLGLEAGSSAGMVEALAGDEPLVQSLRGGLFILAAGNARSLASVKLTRDTVNRVLSDLRGRFDLILVDGDAILTGVASSVIAPQVDGVLLAVGRGQEQALVNSAVKHTEALGGRFAGVVLNRAADTDFSSVMRQQPPAADAGRKFPARLSRFGALVEQVLHSLALTRENELDLTPQEPAELDPAWIVKAA